MWISTYDGGLIRIGEDEDWTIFDPSNSNLPYHTIDDLCLANDGKVWLAMRGSLKLDDTYCHGALFEYYDLTFTKNSPADYIDVTNRLTAIAIDSKNRLWAATSTDACGQFEYALSVYDGVNWKNLTSLVTEIPKAYMPEITFDKKGFIWIGSEKGVIVVNEKTLDVIN